MGDLRQNSFGKEMLPKTIGNKRPDIKNQGIHMYNQLEKYVPRVNPTVSVLTNRSVQAGIPTGSTNWNRDTGLYSIVLQNRLGPLGNSKEGRCQEHANVHPT